MKALPLLLAVGALGAGFFFRDQLQSWTHLNWHHQAPAGVCYLRAVHTFPTASGIVRWTPGQELRTAMDTVAAHGFVTLTDGVNTSEVPQTAVTTDMDDAVALRQLSASSQDTPRPSAERESNSQADASRQANVNRIVSGQFHSTALDVPAVQTNRPENIVSTAGAPVLYYPSVVSGSGGATQGGQVRRVQGNSLLNANQSVARPVSTPVPSLRN